MVTGVIRFGDFELDRVAYQLRRKGTVVPLERKPLEILFLLAENAGQLLTRNEIYQRIWGKSVFVDSENAINTAIRKIRLALNDNARNPQFVIRIAGKGYRFADGVRGRNFTPTSTSSISASKFVGREREMAALRDAVDAAFSGKASLVMVAGEPGIGKTRLSQEAGAYARERGGQVLVGRCYEGEAASPYSPFVEVIREYVSTRPNDALKAEMGDGASALGTLLPEICKRVPDVAHPPTADPDAERMRLFDAVAAFLVNASQANPIMLQLEDLHWGDKPSLLLLQYLARRFKGSRLIVVGTYRDVELDRSHRLSTVLAELKHERLYQRVLLRGLSEPEVKELIEAISQQQTAEGRGATFVRAMLRETEGNPFFIEEVLRHLVESGALYRREGRWVTDPRSIAKMRVPEDVREVIGRRLSRLSETTHRVLAAAAILGREFEFEVLNRMSELDGDAMMHALEEALGHRLLVESQSPRGPRYAFTHALVRQTLVEELSLARKQQFQLKAAQAIETVHEHNLTPHMAALANHYRTAGTATGPEKAIDYSIRAGVVAYGVFAYDEARTHWLAALQLIDDQGGGDRKRRAELLWLLGDEFISGGREAVEYLETAAPIFEELGDSEAACDVQLRLAAYLSTNNVGAMDVPRALPHFTKAEALLAEQPESHRHAMFYISKLGTCAWTRQIGDGLEAGKRAMEISARLDLEGLWCVAAAISSALLIFSGSVSEGLGLAGLARRKANTINDTVVGSRVAWSGAGNYQLLRNPREVQEWCTSELAKPRTLQAVWLVAPQAPPHNVPLFLYQLLVTACVETGELTKARTYLAEADAKHKSAKLLFFEGEWELARKTLTEESERSRRTGNRQGELLAAIDLARFHRFTGELAQAVRFLRGVLNTCVVAGDILFELATRSTLATMAADAGDSREALLHLRRCRQIAGSGENWLGLTGSVERAEAVVASAQGKYLGAETQFAKAIATFKDFSLPWEEADTFQYWGRALLASGDRARAIEMFAAAIEIYRSHGAGTQFVDHVMVDEKRAQRSKSTHPAA